MKKSLIILIGVSFILLLALIVMIAAVKNNATKRDEQAMPSNIIPTSAIGAVSPQSQHRPTPSLNDNLIVSNRAQAIISQLPVQEDGVEIHYSDLLDTFYISNASGDDAVLDRVLAKYDLLQTYRSYPGNFRQTTRALQQLGMDEDSLLTQIEGDDSSANNNDVSLNNEQTKQIEVFGGLLKTFLDFSPPTPTPTSLPQAGANSTQPNTVTSLPSTISNLPVVSGAAGIGAFKVSGIQYDWQNLQHVCVVQPGTKALAYFLQSKFGSSASFGISAGCSTSTSKASQHDEGRAVDYFFHASNPGELKRGNQAMGWLIANARNIGLQYVKFWRVHWTGRSGIHCVDNTISPHDQYTHSNHIHFDINKAAAQKLTPFFTSSVQQESNIIIDQNICPQLDTTFRP